MKSLYPISDALQEQLDRIPDNPGVYQYFDETGTIIYVGKAKNLKRRVHSYFLKDHEDSPKTRVLVKKIRDLKYIVVDTEEDALLLENNLIKEFRPRYNVLLKDDKTYPSICIKKENFPRVFQTRNIIHDGSEYFGPYSSIPMVRTMLDLIKKIYPIRSCKLPLLESAIKQGKYKTCLEYQIKKCLGPCEGLQSEEEYNENIQQIREILKGNVQAISKLLLDKMQLLAKGLQFEEAQQIKGKYELIEQYRSKSAIVNSGLHNIEVFSFDETEQSAIINYLYLVNGCIVRGMTFEYKKRLEEEKEALLSTAIYEMRHRFNSPAKEIIVPFIPEVALENVMFTVPQRGDKKKILDLSLQNVRQYKLDMLKQQEKLNPEQRTTRILTTVKKDLNLHELPLHIECFDNSNIQGSFPVSSCVVFKNAKPSKKDYRHFNIKTVEGPDDFASMEEVLTRRYRRLLEEGQTLPQLVIVDGGKGQLSSAVTALKAVGVFEKLQVIGIAKNLEELFFPFDPIPLYLDKNSETLKLIQQLRDEAHRFGITHHRNRRSKNQILSELDEIPGVGEKAKTLLLKQFKSVKQIREASREGIEKIVGKSKAEKIIVFLHSKKVNE
ncbi:MAG: excinuclease ABC subunit UvrC [Bacteroidales bacterium]|nr:excinuclease ABC subunit UvrC [Bacteroidales bacterium]MDD4711739.1 excinuclease ABC subunit UvrC [Bacteroidales bacterium]